MGANLGGVRRLGSGHGERRRARREGWLGLGDVREGERAKGLQREALGGLKYEGARCTAGPCASEAVAIAASHGGSCGRVWGVPGH